MTKKVGLMAAVFAGGLICGATPAFAQEAAADEEASTEAGANDIIVTATRRPQTLQEVPISVGVVTGAAIEQQGQRLFTDLQASVPNLQIDNTNGNYAITIRGLGSGANNLAFEQSVGLFVDGVYSSRARSLQVPFLDVDRIEVVRGPQGALFGKNTNAGAISMVTRRPTRDFEAEVRGGTELSEGGMNFSGFLSGPVSDTLSLRVSGAVGQADGYIENRLTGFDDGGSKYLSGRAQLLWEPTDDLEVLLKVEGFRNEVNGSNAVYNNIGNANCNLCNIIRNASGGVDAQDQPGFWRFSRGTPAEYDVTKSRTGAMTITWKPGEWSITSLSAYQWVDSERTFNTIPGPIDLLNTLQAESSDQIFQELRIARDIAAGINLSFGATYTDANLDILQLINYNGNLVGTTLPQAKGTRAFTQSSWSLSPFASLEADLVDGLTFSGSLRYSYEKKRARGTSTNVGPRIPANNLDFNLRGQRTEKLWDYSLRLRYEFSPQVSTYVSYATGTKGGGFLSNDGLLLYNIQNGNGRFDFEDERARAWELGTKMRLLDRRLDIDVALFRTRFTNLQVSSYNGTAFITGNAAKATAQGVEVETRFRPSRAFSLGATGAYLDAKYGDYPGGPCLYNAPVGCTPVTNNLAGVRLTRAPEWKAAGFVQLDLPVSDALIFSANGSADYTSKSYLQGDLNPLNTQPGYTKFNARVAIRAESGAWELALVGRNITNKVTFSQAFNTPLLGGNSHVVMINPPRTINLEGVVRF
jgi:iron complex outermembrane receptor protein